jgi:hypothetical protein
VAGGNLTTRESFKYCYNWHEDQVGCKGGALNARGWGLAAAAGRVHTAVAAEGGVAAN